ncbi:hypothetical protein KEM48_007970 [Puccinia striiformis f. sp. tritici PST-130]|nr:hypothetical protein KEM48_007970 [Puccinia striiformis f. sp. tritici PST-130]
MSESDIAVAASKALQQISSSAKQRAKSKTSTTSNKKDEILDIFMSPDKPKSRLRLLAQNSAKKYNTSSSSSPVEVKQEDQEQFVLDLGIPRNKKLTTNDYIKPPSRPRKSFSSSNNPPPRSSTLNRRQSSPTKSPKPTIDILLDDLDLDTIKQNNNHNNNPFQMNSSTKKEESDQSSDSFDVKVLLEPKTEPTAEEEENPTTRNRVGSKPKRVIADSDGDTPSVSTKSPKSTIHPKLLPTTTTTLPSIHPSRAIRFQKLRSQALKKGAHSATCCPNNRDSTSDDDSEIQIQSKDNRNKSSPPKPVPSPQREVKEIDTTKKTKSKVTDTQKTKSIKVTDKETKSKPTTDKAQDTEPTKKVRASTKKPPKEIDTSFPKIREKLAQDLLIELNTKVFKNQLPSSIELIWSKRLNSTAGRAHLISVKDPNTGAKGYKIKVELAQSHHQLKENHGRFFKAWGHRVHSVMKDITITTKHNYDIDYKFKWMCCKDDCDRQ